MSDIEGINPIDHSDVLDSRDIIARIAYLETTAPIDREPDEQDELDNLYALQEEASMYAADWQYGETLIADDYFEDYAEEMAYDIGAIDREASWPLNRIDWEAAADDLKMDYNEVSLTIDGDTRTYWIR